MLLMALKALRMALVIFLLWNEQMGHQDRILVLVHDQKVSKGYYFVELVLLLPQLLELEV
jgi:hypothetical protein